MGIFRGMVAIVLVLIVAFVAYVWLGGTGPRSWSARDHIATGTTGNIDVNAARERGAEAGAKIAVAAEEMKQEAAEAALTTKIKAKMVLDDSVKARAIDVMTAGSTVTLSGIVRSQAEHDRAVRLARETAGVTRVVDHLKIER